MAIRRPSGSIIRPGSGWPFSWQTGCRIRSAVVPTESPWDLHLFYVYNDPNIFKAPSSDMDLKVLSISRQ